MDPRTAPTSAARYQRLAAERATPPNPVPAPTDHSWLRMEHLERPGVTFPAWPPEDRVIEGVDVGYRASWTARPILRYLVNVADCWHVTAHRHRQAGIIREQGTLTVTGQPAAVDRYLRMLNRVDGLHTFPRP